MTTDDEPVGSLGSEAAQLLEALQDWAREAGSAEHIATGSPACTYCPLCRVISAVRDNPEVREQLTAAATSLVDAVVGMLAHGGQRTGARPDEDPDGHPDEEAGRRHDEEAD